MAANFWPSSSDALIAFRHGGNFIAVISRRIERWRQYIATIIRRVSGVPADAYVGCLGFWVVVGGLAGETKGPTLAAAIAVRLKRVKYVDAGIVTDAFYSRCDSGQRIHSL